MIVMPVYSVNLVVCIVPVPIRSGLVGVIGASMCHLLRLISCRSHPPICGIRLLDLVVVARVLREVVHRPKI